MDAAGARLSAGRRLALALAALAVWAAVSLAALPAPWVWIGIGWFAIAWAASWTSPDRSLVWFNLGIAFLVLGLFEAVAWFRPAPHFDPERIEGYAGPDDVLGYAPQLTGPVRVSKFYGEHPIFDVVYTFDRHHLRVSAPPDRPEDPEAPCILFFGGSYTYGEGVEDAQSLPWRAAVLTGMRTRNFGFQGYGPHQMLAAIESGRVERAAECRPTFAIYMPILDHVNRAVGLAHWDRSGPRYRLAPDGSAVRDGHFDDDTGALARFALEQFEKSLIVERVNQRRREVGADDFAVFHAIVDTARRRLAERWPGIGFHAIVWDRSGDPPPLFWEGLERRGIAVHRMSRILPQRRDGDPRFEVSEYDRHPGGVVYDAIARYVARRIVGRRPPRRAAPT